MCLQCFDTVSSAARSGGCWHGYLSVARCKFAYGPANATATQSLASVKSRLVLVLGHLGNPGQNPEGRKMDVCVCVGMGVDNLCLFVHCCTHTHTRNRFTARLEYVRVHPGEQVPER